MRVLYAYNRHRGGGGADNAARATIDVSRRQGVQVEVFTRNSEDLPRNIVGRLRAGLSVIYAPHSVREFSRLLNRFKPDLVHIHEIFPLVSPWILPPCSRRGIPVVMTCVDYRMTCPVVTHFRDGSICTRCTGGREYWAILKNCRRGHAASVSVALYNTLVRRLGLFARHVEHFIAPSEFTRQWLIQHAEIEPARITTINPVVEIPARAADPGVGEYVAFAGRFSPEKGIDTLVQAARLFDLPFRLARNNNSLIAVDVPPEVDVAITRNRAELSAFYRNARMLVVPSAWFETFGLVGAEAMSHGIPVVGARIGAIADLVRDGVDGLLFESRNAVDLAEKVTRLWYNPEFCRRLGRAGRDKAMTQWSPERHFERHMALYEQLRTRRPARRLCVVPQRRGRPRPSTCCAELDGNSLRGEAVVTSAYNDAPQRPRDMELLGLPIHDVGVDKIYAFVEETISKRQKAIVLHSNVHGVNLACKHPWLYDFYQKAHLVFCDGDGVRLGLKILGYSPPPKITYNEWLWQLAAFCERKEYRLFLLGGRPGIAQEAARRLKERSPRLNIVGLYDGFFRKRGENDDTIIARINAASPDILLVCLGMPLQERWLADNWSLLDVHVFLTGGAAVDYVSGRLGKAPSWMVRSHLEWLYRFWQEPGRLFGRYMIGNPVFLARVLREKVQTCRGPRA